jgi:hypothetical protein
MEILMRRAETGIIMQRMSSLKKRKEGKEGEREGGKERKKEREKERKKERERKKGIARKFDFGLFKEERTAKGSGTL